MAYEQPVIDVPALASLLDGRYAAVREDVKANLLKHVDLLSRVDELPKDDYRDLVRDVVVQIAETGQCAHHFPQEYGGLGDFGATVAAFETTAFSDQSVLVKVGVQFGLFGGAILNLGTKPHHDAYLNDLAFGRLLGCFGMTETGHGSNVQSIGTVARYDKATQEFVITTPDDASRKDYIGNAARHAELGAIFAQLEIEGPDGEPQSQGVHCFVVPLRNKRGKVLPGIRIEDCGPKMGLNGVDNGRIWFDDVRVPREALLNKFADVSPEGVYASAIENPNRRFFTMLGTLVMGRVCVGGAGISTSKVALAIAIRYADRRRQFTATNPDREDLLLDYGMHQRRLLPLLARTYALHFAQDVLREQFHSVFMGHETDERKVRNLESRAAGTKAAATWHATRTIQECREACGGAGYLATNRFTALKADTDIYTTFEGDNTVLMQLVAKGLLTDYSSNFQELDQLGTVQFVASMAVEQIVEATMVHRLLERLKDALPGGDEWDQEAGLLDPNYQLKMFEFREEHQLQGVAKRLKRGIDQKMNPGEVFSRVQDHVIATAHAHVERIILQAFVNKVAEQPDGPTKVALGLLCDLYALSTIEADRAWWMEHGRLSTQRGKAISREVMDLCRKLRPLAVDLVNAFDIPEPLLRADELLNWE
jgi:acyl-CoA oxidase